MRNELHPSRNSCSVPTWSWTMISSLLNPPTNRTLSSNGEMVFSAVDFVWHKCTFDPSEMPLFKLTYSTAAHLASDQCKLFADVTQMDQKVCV